ncbi:hypothetical protein [Actinoplanes sp. HUAS TT8]|uniref:hypothetical protein n=1 Tax=Actinoplanes sp. HUAS TT8 TaxID=3447453 RepID=UPI003F51F73E
MSLSMIKLLRRRAAAPTHDELARLHTQLAAATAEADQLQQLADERLRLHQADIARVGERLRSEAGIRGWGDEFEDVIDALNQQLTVDIIHRGRPFLVDTTLTVDLTVDARGAAAAREAATATLRLAEGQLRQLAGVHVYQIYPQDLDVIAIGRRSAILRAGLELRVELGATNERHARGEAVPIFAAAVAALHEFDGVTASAPDASTFDISPR